jgi:hypothetical protein
VTRGTGRVFAASGRVTVDREQGRPHNDDRGSDHLAPTYVPLREDVPERQGKPRKRPRVR